MEADKAQGRTIRIGVGGDEVPKNYSRKEK